jgi:hypothetical protein
MEGPPFLLLEFVVRYRQPTAVGGSRFSQRFDFGANLRERRKAMDKIIVRSGDTELEVDFKRFLFGDGKWVVTVRGADLFG